MNETTTDVEKDSDRGINQTHVPCPYWLEMIPYFLTFLLMIIVAYMFIDTEPIQWRFPVFSYVFAGLCIISWCYLLFERWYFYGNNGFYEIYWYCHMGLLLTSIGIFMKLPNLIGQSMVLTLFPHVSFWVDTLLYPFCKRSVIGSAAFMFDKDTPLHEKCSTLHHYWYFPGIIFILYGQPPLSIWCYPMSIVLFIIMNICSHYMTPMSYIDPNGKERLLNICVAFVAPDFLVNLPPFSWGAEKPYFIHILIATLCYNVPFNYVAYLIIIIIQKLVNMI